MQFIRSALLSSTTVFALFVATPLIAQSTRTIQIGVLAGPSFSRMKGKDAASDLKVHTGIMAGVSLVVSGATPLALELDALFATKGFKSVGRVSSFELGTGFLEIPVLLRVQRTAAMASVRPFVVFGPAVGVRVSCGYTLTASGTSSDIACEDAGGSSGQAISKSAVSGVLGAGIEFPVGGLHVTAGARYSRGLTHAIKDWDNHFESTSFYLGLTRGRRK